MGSGEGHCNKRDSCEHPGGSGRENGERSGVGVRGGKDEVC